MTAVIYARYSSDNQREESIEGQIRECTAYAEKNGITVVKHYIDRALSAKTDNRPDFQQMIKDSESGCLISCWSGNSTVLPETAMIRPTMSICWNEIMSSWYLPRSLSLTALRVSWSRVC